MNEFYKEFEIRWSELDPNYHVANYAYSQFMNEVRISYMIKNGIDRSFIQKGNMGPVIFHEHFYYIKEIRAYEKIKIDVQMKGHSEDYKFLNFAHHLYLNTGEIAMYSELMFAWMNLESRKLTFPLAAYIERYDQMQKTDDFRILKSDDIRAQGIPYKKITQPFNA